MPSVTLYSDAPIYGGAERYLELLATELDRDRYRPDVVLSTSEALDPAAARLAAVGISVTRLPAVETLSRGGAFFRVFRRLAWHRPTLIHFNLTDPRSCNGALLAAKLAGHARFVTTEHLPQSPFDDGPTPLRHRLATAWTTRRIALNQAGRAALLARGIPAGSIDVVPNGVPDPGPPYSAARERARATLGIAPEAPLLAFVGRLEPQKRPALFLEIVRRLAPAIPGLRAAFFGDGALRSELEDAVRRDEALRPRVAFYGRRDDLAALYPGFDLVVMTSSYEGQPLTLIEAGLGGVPAVAGRIPGVDEIVVEGETGRLVAPDDPDAYAVAALAYFSAPETMRRAGALARLRMLTEHSPVVMARATADVYDRALRLRPAGGV
jgi:glycosyltransferase involved in cell wall biosynthesis